MRRRGFTMLEVLVAAAVMALVLVAVLQVIGGSIRAHTTVKMQTTLLPLAQSKLDEILKEPLIDVGEERGNFGDELAAYEWIVAIEPSIDPNLMTVRVTVYEVGDAERSQVTLTSMRRLEITPLPPEEADPNATGTAAAGGAA